MSPPAIGLRLDQPSVDAAASLAAVMLAGVPVLADAVAKLADTVRATGADALADRLEVAHSDGVALLALTIDDRAIILG